MAIFEQKIERKITLDDTERITCLIETTQKIDKHTEYVLKIQRGPLNSNSWRVYKRYNDFSSLNSYFKSSGINLPFPSKKIIGNMHPEFIAQRRIELQEFINTVLMNPILASSLTTKRFVDPDSYTVPFHDLALQHATMCLRTEGVYTVGQSLGAIGWRLRKHYFKVVQKSSNSKQSPSQSSTKHLVKSGSQSSHSKHSLSNVVSTSIDKDKDHVKEDLILCWTEYGPDKYIDEKEIHNVFKNFCSVQHPYIQPMEFVASNDSGALVIRKLNKSGSLKDMLCNANPLNPFLAKYGSPKGRSPLPLKELAMYGRQILEALRFLHSKGMPYGHVHAGNVVISDGVARLLDIENFILGVPSFYRPFFVQHSKLNTFDVIDVYGFGQLIFEMSMGYPLQESFTRQITDCPESLKSLLESILTKDAFKTSLPTLDQLTLHPFFAEHASEFNESYARLTANTKPYLKFSTNAKEQIKIAIQRTETRLRDEQKSVKNQKRLVRVQEFMTSEEEKKKIKHKAKLEHKQAKLRAQTSLQLQNGPSPLNASMPRSDSVSSVSSLHDSGMITSPPQSAGILSAPPLPVPPPMPFNLPVSIPSTSTAKDTQRVALLESICKFNKTGLKQIDIKK